MQLFQIVVRVNLPTDPLNTDIVDNEFSRENILRADFRSVFGQEASVPLALLNILASHNELCNVQWRTILELWAIPLRSNHPFEREIFGKQTVGKSRVDCVINSRQNFRFFLSREDILERLCAKSYLAVAL